ncbi:MAG: PEP-CTERM sorting domain-containing protein [Aquabacterium sp.]|nr:MAG: PEP-CTERM sorting domain-containing protein [Aquabacterium sp.]
MFAVRSVLRRSCVAIATCAALGAAAVAAPAQAASYTVSDLGPSGFSSNQIGALVAFDINAQGQVVGTHIAADGLARAFVTAPNGGAPVTISPDSYGLIAAYGINGAGQVTGSSAFFYDPASGGGAVRLPGLGGEGSGGRAINASGQVAGGAALPADPDTGLVTSHAFVTAPGGGALTDLGTLGGSSSAQGINDSGQVVGYSEIVPGGQSHAFVATIGAGMRDLGTFIEGNAGSSFASAINNAGSIVGYASSLNGTRAFITEAGGQGLTGLVSLGQESFASDINDLGQVVGNYRDDAGTNHAFLWQGGTMVELTDAVDGSGWTLEGAQAINDKGQIVGWGVFNGERRAFLLTPVPEPATWMLTALGLGLAVAVQRRAKR